jgi:hypothetical protein
MAKENISDFGPAVVTADNLYMMTAKACAASSIWNRWYDF